MVKVPRNYFSEIAHYLLQGKLSVAFARGVLPLISIFCYNFFQLRYQFIILKNLGRSEIIVRINNNYNMKLDLHDKGICQELSIYKKREFFSTDYFKKIITQDMIIIDIGGNIGYYALLESILSSKGTIYAIEPVSKNFNLLKKNIELNNRHNVCLYPFAISNVNGNSTMYIYDRCNWSSFIKNPEGTIVSTINVPVLTLDEFIKSYMDKYPSFIRMDVEGSEFNILKGAFHTLNSISPLIICIEFHPHLMSKENTMECIDILKTSGFKIQSIFRETMSCDYKYIKIINKLRDVVNWPRIGYCGDNYESLERLFNNGYGAMVFFEKTN